MRFSTCLVAAAATVAASAQYAGFNYGSTFTNGTALQQSDFEADFSRAKTLQGTNGAFTSARLYTMIQAGTTDTPISAIPAAIDTQTTLLLGLWASAGQADFTNELTALTSAINQYGTSFTSLIVGISVGSEDLYRNSPTGIQANGYDAGANPSVLVDYIGQTRSAIAKTVASGISVGHVDTWTAYVNSSNDAVISACDWLGMDAYPYFQNTMANSIDVANSTFYDAYQATVGAAQGKKVWVTETGWPVSGPTENQAVASPQNAEIYWQDVACSLLGNINTWWYTLQDADPTTPSPSFGIVDSDLNSAPLYNLTCANGNVQSSSSLSASASSSASSASAPASSAGPNTASIIATPNTETSPASVSLSRTESATSASSQAAGSVAPQSSAPVSPTAITSQSSFATVASPPANTASPTASASGNSCPANLDGGYQYPHLLVPVNSESPEMAYGTQYNGVISPNVTSLINFDVPSSYAGKTCSLVFPFPEQAALKTSAYTFNAQGGISVNELSSPATQETTYNSVPKTAVAGIGSIADLKEGSSYVITTQSCAAGKTVGYAMESTGGLDLKYFQDSQSPSPIGVYMTVC